MTKKCSGCGVLLQNDNIDKEGYVDDLNKDICERCFKLKYYGEYKEVTLDNKDYQNILNSIPKDSLVVYLTSLLSLNLDIINNFNNVIIVLTKKDLLPKSVKDYKLIDYVSKRVNNYLDIEVISSVKNYNLDTLDPKEPVTQSIWAFFPTIAFLVFKFIIFLDQFSIVEYLK